MSNEFKLADTTRAKLIYTKDELLAPLLPGMEEPPHPRRLGPSEEAYFLGLPRTGQPDNRRPVATTTQTGVEKEAGHR
jgi:NADH-quinone oxidoreductase subunit I